MKTNFRKNYGVTPYSNSKYPLYTPSSANGNSQHSNSNRTNLLDLILSKPNPNQRTSAISSRINTNEYCENCSSGEIYVKLSDFNSFVEYIESRLNEMDENMHYIENSTRIKTEFSDNQNSARKSQPKANNSINTVHPNSPSELVKTKIADIEKTVLALKSNFRKYKEELSLEQKSLITRLEELYDCNKIKGSVRDILNKDKLEIYSSFNDLKKVVKEQLFSAFETLTSLGKFSSDIIQKQDKVEYKLNQIDASIFEHDSTLLNLQKELKLIRYERQVKEGSSR